MTQETRLKRWTTRESWTIPDAGAEIWCSGWAHREPIKPYGDGCHVKVGSTIYHCDQLIEILERWERDGHTWGIVTSDKATADAR